MSAPRTRSWIGQILLFTVLSLLFSALPFLIALSLDKSNLALAIFLAWYAVAPPAILLLLTWLYYWGEASSVRMAARLCISVGLWFGVQALLSALSGYNLLILLFTLPAMLAGGQGYLAGALLFLGAGLVLLFIGSFTKIGEVRRPNRLVYALSTVGLLVMLLLAVPLFIWQTSSSRSAMPTAGAPGLPSEEEVFSYTAAVYDMGIRRTGWEATAQAKDYIASQLEAFGFEEVHIEPFQFDFWRENAWGLIVDPGGQAWAPETFFVPYSGPTGPEGVSAELVYLAGGSEADFAAQEVSGRIVLVDLPPMNISWDQMKLFTYMAYDPVGTAANWEHPYPIGWLEDVRRVHDLAERHGAAGILGVLQGYPEMGKFGYYAPYDGVLRPVPGLYLLDKDGDRLREMVKAGPVVATLTMDAQVSMQGGTAWSVYGVLPGGDDQIIMVHTHYDAPWQSGIEDSSGVGMVMGLARYFAELPQSQRAHKMIFIFMGSHMVGAPSNHAFMEEHAGDIMANLLLDICLEHIADDYNPPNPPTRLVEPRGNFIFENPIAVSLYAGVVRDFGAYRTLIFPTGSPLSVPTDAGMFAVAGYPVSSFISGPVWLFDDDDTLDRVAHWEFAALSAMYVDYIQRLGRVAPPLLRFNLNVWVVALTALVFIPLATLSAVHRPRT